MTTLNSKVKAVSGLAGTDALNSWEESFVTNIVRQTNNGDNTTSLTERQIDRLEEIFNKHFAH